MSRVAIASQPLARAAAAPTVVLEIRQANLSIPEHNELSVGTLRALIRSAGMTVEEFLSLLG